jgi:ACS family pantothenate transporter-like MFS transporter
MVKHRFKAGNGFSSLVFLLLFFLMIYLQVPDGAMGVPFGIFGLVLFPNLPESPNAPYLSQDEVQLALDRLPPKKEWSHDISLKSLVKRLFATPDLYILTAYSIIGCALEAITLQGLFLLWMKAHVKDFPPRAITTYPLGIQAVSIVSNIGAGFVIDSTNRRIPMVIVAGSLQLIVAILLLVPNLSTAGVFFAFYLSGTSYIVNPVIYGWASVICQRTGDDAARSVTLYIMSMVQSILYTFWGIALYPSTDAPYWKKGYITMIVVVFAFFGTTAAVNWVSNPFGLRSWYLTDCCNSLTKNPKELFSKLRNARIPYP